MEGIRRRARLDRPSVAVAMAVLIGASCSFNTLGGREKCWPEADARLPSLWRGILRVDGFGAQLDTPEGDVISLLPGVLTTRVGGDGVGELIQGGDVVAPAGADISLFGGMASDGSLVVCGVEEIHGAG